MVGAPRASAPQPLRGAAGSTQVVYSRERSPTLTVSETCPFTNQGDANVRFFIRVRFCTVYLVIKLSPGTPLSCVSELSILSRPPSARSKRTARLRRPRNVRVAPTKQSL